MRPFYALSAAFFAASLFLTPVAAADAPAVAADSDADGDAAKDEVAVVNALVEANLPDIAVDVIEAAKKRWPDLGPKLKVLEVQGELRLGNGIVAGGEAVGVVGVVADRSAYAFSSAALVLSSYTPLTVSPAAVICVFAVARRAPNTCAAPPFKVSLFEARSSSPPESSFTPF